MSKIKQSRVLLERLMDNTWLQKVHKVTESFNDNNGEYIVVPKQEARLKGNPMMYTNEDVLDMVTFPHDEPDSFVEHWADIDLVTDNAIMFSIDGWEPNEQTFVATVGGVVTTDDLKDGLADMLETFFMDDDILFISDSFRTLLDNMEGYGYTPEGAVGFITRH